jgi:hypothetical protein
MPRSGSVDRGNYCPGSARITVFQIYCATSVRENRLGTRARRTHPRLAQDLSHHRGYGKFRRRRFLLRNQSVKRCWRVSPIISLRGDPTRTRRTRVEKLYSVQIRRLPLADVRSPTTHCGPLSGQLPRCRACLFLGTKRTCRPRCATSAFRGKAENICSHRAFPVLMLWTAPLCGIEVP